MELNITIKELKIMKILISILGMSCILIVQSCKDKDPKIKNTFELSEEMMNYFVNYEVGTKWIYQDVNNLNLYDTIKLVSKENYDINSGNGTLKKGFELYYQPKISKDFKVFVNASSDNSYFVKIDPLISAAGKVTFENYNGNWSIGVIYHDSLNIKGKNYYKVIESQSNSDYHGFVHYGKNQGIVFFSRMNGGTNLGNYKLINTLKP